MMATTATTALVVERKRRRLLEPQPTTEDAERAKLGAADAVAALLGRRVRVFLNPKRWGTRGGDSAARAAGATTMAVIRVIFPDGYVMEAKFAHWETAQQLVDLLRRALRRPDLPFYVYTAPPKERLVDLSADFETVGFVPGANVYFSWESPEGEWAPWLGPCLRDEVRALQWLDLRPEDI